jgi:NAD(P)-dependent dehydrogenase (short-subunit alcohol dehydrogenase family)
MSTEPITLFGDIPGLLRRGCPVWHGRDAEHPGRETIVIDVDDEGGPALCVNDYSSDYGAQMYDLAALSLDLRDEAGVDRAVRWLAERMGLRLWLGAPTFRRPWTKSNRCVLSCGAEAVRFDSEDVYPNDRSDVIVPALAAIPLDHPDADLLALRAVILHVAGRAS